MSRAVDLESSTRCSPNCGREKSQRVCMIDSVLRPLERRVSFMRGADVTAEIGSCGEWEGCCLPQAVSAVRAGKLLGQVAHTDH